MSSDSSYIAQDQMEEIDRYVRGEMTDTEHVQFEKRIADDEKLRQAVTNHLSLIEGIEAASLQTVLDSFHAEIEQTGSKNGVSGSEERKGRPIIKYLVAASVLLVMGLGAWYFMSKPNPQQQLFAAHFTPDPGLITPMSSTDRYQFYSGMIEYKREDYREAITRWEPLLQTNSQSDTLNYFLGVAYLAMGEEDEAVPYLQSNIEIGGAFIDEAYFYLGLAYLKGDQNEAAVNALLKSGDERARSLLADMDGE